MKKILHILAAAAVFFSCSDDFLDKKPLDKLSEEDVFNNDALAEAYVNSFYVAIPDPFTEGNIGCCSDEGFFRYGGTSTNYIARGQMTPDNVMYMSEGGAAHNTRMTFRNIWNRRWPDSQHERFPVPHGDQHYAFGSDPQTADRRGLFPACMDLCQSHRALWRSSRSLKRPTA